jgi:retron-type reverse transcriptase
MKRVMRPQKRRKTQSAIMKKLKADATFEARRLAGIQKAKADPEQKARRIATFAKALAVPSVARRRIKNSRKATKSREYRAAMSAKKKKFWADLRAPGAN